VNLGIMFANGVGVAKDTGRAATLFQGACGAGIGAGCDHFGLALEFGQGIQQDLPRAIETLKKGCDLKNAEACNRRALMAERAQGSPKDPVTAVSFYQKACDLGDAFGCGNLANHLASGDGVPKDPLDASLAVAVVPGTTPASAPLAASASRWKRPSSMAHVMAAIACSTCFPSVRAATSTPSFTRNTSTSMPESRGPVPR
jgi:TPR repeat protein